MSMGDIQLPHWTWEDLEAVLDGFCPLGADHPVRAHLLRGLADDARRATPRELLREVLSAGLVMARMEVQRGDSATDPHPAAGAYAS